MKCSGCGRHASETLVTSACCDEAVVAGEPECTTCTFFWSREPEGHNVCNHGGTLYSHAQYCRDDENDPCGPLGLLFEPDL